MFGGGFAGPSSAVTGVRGYPESMRRPDIELSDEAAAYVERHPEVITRLAAQDHEAQPAVSPEQRRRFRAYIRERRAAAGTPEAAQGRRAFLARYGLQ